MTSQDTQQRPIPNVPEGTPGRDWRAELPAPLPQGSQQPWRRHGPGSRTWVGVLTAVVLVIMAVVGIFAVSFGFATTAFEREGVVVLTPSEYVATSKTCSGARDAAGVREGSRIVFRNGSDSFGTELGAGVLRSGRCVFPFTLSSVHADPDVNYAVTVGDAQATPVAGSELASTSGTLMVSLAG
ncbi:hypothetical protein ACFWXB_12105 [Tsukamurella tyrosinosolvens]|uniref:hypothetical protein n=1 Tax=Tsukamurella tyrosinosolvens TaxID=57704 RepID=UPI000C7F4760|nr:hypothetical protein [Tsukamurella tyrosinosolvens]AUN40937.1 hypothetical protein ASU32_13735 [Tsukamurella tyrosinosolvens]MEC4612570.1 hypothetical protein [Tsukamurella tyrosinosolvens]